MTTVQEQAIANLKTAGLGDVLYVPGEKPYHERIDSYWSLTPRLKPWAIVQPRTTEEVSRVLKTLVAITGCKFAIRSGGHMCFPGANNIEAGVTIDLGLLRTTTYNPVTKIASLQPGGKWTDVYATLEKEGVMVAGGREGLVGVGGLLTGGGKTLYTCRYGFACDQVVNYEVVLADGSIVEVNGAANADLFLVLRGGSNNFGIVTRFDMVTFEVRDIWDGIVVYPKTATDSLVEAFVDFCANLTQQPDDHILGIWTYMPQTAEHFVSMFLTNLDGVENPKSHEKFLAIPGERNMKKTTVAKKLAEFELPSGKYDNWFTLTFKLDARIVKKAADIFENMVEELKLLVPDSNFYISMVLQPLLKSSAAHSATRGGNILGLERLPGDCVLLVGTVEVDTAELSATVAFPKFKEAIEEIESFAKSVDGDVEFRYLNYSNGSQDPLGSYGGDNIRKMQEAAAKYDPNRVFQERVPGGFKIPKV
ncbi:FAD-binding domain-containing protein, partial [Biscogniauxia marginata]